MSNPEKTKMETEEEIIEGNSDGSDYEWSDLEEGEIRELVLALPALSVGENLHVNDQLHQEAVLAANLVVAAAQDAAVATGTMETATAMELAVGETSQKKKLGRPRKDRLEEGEAVKKTRKKGSPLLTNPPKGPPTCNVCDKVFISWKAVFGHLRSHKDRGYQGFLPPPTFNAGEKAPADVAAASSSSDGADLGIGGLGFDLNVDPMEEEAEETETGPTPKFDLNRSPPQEEEGEDKEGDKAE